MEVLYCVTVLVFLYWMLEGEIL